MIKTQNHLPSSGDKEELLDTTHKKTPLRQRRAVYIAIPSGGGEWCRYVTR